MSSDFEGRVQAKAKEIIDVGNSYDYILSILAKRYFGTPLIGRILLLSVGSGSISDSSGIHVQICGKAGSGKSEAAKKLSDLVHPKYRLVANVTPQALFYPIESFVDSSVVFIDDIVWKEELGNSVKKITGMFQDGAERIVTTDGMGKRQTSAKRLTFWVTSVDNQAEEQVRDRFFLVECDSSVAAMKKIKDSIFARASGKTTLKVDDTFETAVCHALFEELKSCVSEVVIPFSETIKFDGDTRASMMFLDMVRNFAVFAKKTRKLDAQNRIEATVEDYERAKALYEDLGGHSAYKLTDGEIRFLDALKEFGRKATKAQMQQITGLSLGYVGDILNGTKSNGQNGHGLFYKCPFLSKDDSVRPYLIVLSEDY
jgi:energy-coupling factor transporter ATP-binding protein EcfA2